MPVVRDTRHSVAHNQVVGQHGRKARHVRRVHADQQKPTGIDRPRIKRQQAPQQSVGGRGAMLPGDVGHRSEEPDGSKWL